MTQVLALPGAVAFGQRLARLLRCGFSPLALHRFPDGESLVRVDTAVDGDCVVLAGSLDAPDGKTLPLLFAADAVRELGARQVGLAAPYLPYMRQDRRFRPGEAISSRSYARLLSAAFDFLVTVDPHLHRWQHLGDIYSIPTATVAAAPRIARWVRREVPKPLLVGPDQESEQWVAEVARLVGAPATVLAKRRHGDTDVSVSQLQGSWPDRTPVLLDDIVSTGHTIAAAAQALRTAGMAAPVCVAVHALFDAAAQDRLRSAGIARLVSCDTVPHPSNAIGVSGLVAMAVRQLSQRCAGG